MSGVIFCLCMFSILFIIGLTIFGYLKGWLKIHNNKRIWYKYLYPKRLTLKCNPRIHRWLWFVW
jgi:hypothetical protein